VVRPSSKWILILSVRCDSSSDEETLVSYLPDSVFYSGPHAIGDTFKLPPAPLPVLFLRHFWGLKRSPSDPGPYDYTVRSPQVSVHKHRERVNRTRL
jgi:hypothetical protein